MFSNSFSKRQMDSAIVRDFKYFAFCRETGRSMASARKATRALLRVSNILADHKLENYSQWIHPRAKAPTETEKQHLVAIAEFCARNPFAKRGWISSWSERWFGRSETLSELERVLFWNEASGVERVLHEATFIPVFLRRLTLARRIWKSICASDARDQRKVDKVRELLASLRPPRTYVLPTLRAPTLHW